eukprot:TRINITY_DN3267_c0_g1_i3.p3 TRINITY_DN3267_c0_g1~~TRINITY_DN3267_c0_g1_i3.p3  ORF type:complete len:120 (-),score=4.33 TRINITY_DN3267_c0_g1_i3:674-1033(-)
MGIQEPGAVPSGLCYACSFLFFSSFAFFVAAGWGVLPAARGRMRAWYVHYAVFFFSFSFLSIVLFYSLLAFLLLLANAQKTGKADENKKNEKKKNKSQNSQKKKKQKKTNNNKEEPEKR